MFGTGMTGRIQIGQVWRQVETGQTFLVTRVYTEALATIAVLRRTGAENEAMLRVKVERSGSSQTLPGFDMAHDSESI